MKCITCANPIVIKTDPKNNTYDYNTGIRKMEHDYTPDEDDQVIAVGQDDLVTGVRNTLIDF